MSLFVANSATQQQEYGEQFAQSLLKRDERPLLVFLSGDMGAGKTTFVKGVLQGLAYDGVVTSPTYNLIHEYPCEVGKVCHIDLYRVDDPDELENIALYDVIDESAIVFIEWPEKAQGLLPKANISISIRVLEVGREISIK